MKSSVEKESTSLETLSQARRSTKRVLTMSRCFSVRYLSTRLASSRPSSTTFTSPCWIR